MRIKARAIRRTGELMELFKSKGGRPKETDQGDLTSFSAKEAGEKAGLSKHQRDTASAAAKIPEALPLLMSALGFFGFIGWRRKRLAAA